MKKVYLLLFTLLCLFSFNKIGYATVVQNTTGEGGSGPKTIRIQNVKSCEPYNLTTGEKEWSSFQSYAKYDYNGTTFIIECTGDGQTEIRCTQDDTIIIKKEINCTKPTNSSSNTASGVGREDVLNDKNNEEEPTSNVLKNLCSVEENPDVMRAFKLGGLALNILKIMIPILLIIFGCIDLAQAVISSDEKQLSKSVVKLVQRVIAGVVIFIIPTVVEYIFNMVDSSATSKYKGCYECLLDVSKCPEIPKVGAK